MFVRTLNIALLLLLTACNLIQSNTASTPLPTADKTAVLTVAWVEAGNLVVWRQGDSLPRRIASGGVVRPYLAPDGQHVAFTRGVKYGDSERNVLDVASADPMDNAPHPVLLFVAGDNFTDDSQQADAAALLQQAMVFFNAETK